MSALTWTAGPALGLFVGMLALIELGRRLGHHRYRRDEERGRAGLGAVEGAVFALMGLLIAFTFSGAATRFDHRRELIVQEANCIGTAWLRLDLLPAASQPVLRDLFRRYVDARLAVYADVEDPEATRKKLAEVAVLQGEIWRLATAACRDSVDPVKALLIPALNEMFDIASTRVAVTEIHPPTIVFILLGALALMSALLAGYAMAGSKARSWVHVIGFALILSCTVYLILDMEYPRLGYIRVDAMDHLLVELRQSMNP